MFSTSMSRVRFFGDVDNSEEEEDNDDMSSVTTNVGGVAPSNATRKKGSGISVELPVSAHELLLKVASILDSEEDRAQLFNALRLYHESRKIKKLVRELKIVLNTEKKYPLFKVIRALLPSHHVALYDKLTTVSKNGERLIRIQRTGSGSMGFTFRGGIEHGIGFYVTSVREDSPAHKAGLRVSDQIRKINGLPLHESIHEEVLSIFRNKSSVTLLVKNIGRIPSKINNEIVWSVISDTTEPVVQPDVTEENDKQEEKDRLLAFKVGKDGLGCSIRSGIKGHRGIYVVAVEKNTLAEQVGLKIGDQILDTNGKDFVYISHLEAVEFLRDKVQLTMIVRHSTEVKRIIEDSEKEVIEVKEEPLIKKVRFGDEEKVEYIDIEPYEIKDEEDEDVVLPNESNFDYPEEILEGKEVHYVSIPKKGPLAFNIEQKGDKILVKSIARRGAIAEHGFIRVGDWLLNVEGTELIDVTEAQANASIVKAFSDWSKYIEFIVACPPGRIPSRLPTKEETSQTVKEKTYFLSAKLLNQHRKMSMGGVRGAVESFELQSDIVSKSRKKRRDSIEKIQLSQTETDDSGNNSSSSQKTHKQIFSKYTSAAPKKQAILEGGTIKRKASVVSVNTFLRNDANIDSDGEAAVEASKKASTNGSSSILKPVEGRLENVDKDRLIINSDDDRLNDGNEPRSGRASFISPLVTKKLQNTNSSEGVVNASEIQREDISKGHSYGGIGYLTKDFQPSSRSSALLDTKNAPEHVKGDYGTKDFDTTLTLSEVNKSLSNSFSIQRSKRIHRHTERGSVLNNGLFEHGNSAEAKEIIPSSTDGSLYETNADVNAMKSMFEKAPTDEGHYNIQEGSVKRKKDVQLSSLKDHSFYETNADVNAMKSMFDKAPEKEDFYKRNKGDINHSKADSGSGENNKFGERNELVLPDLFYTPAADDEASSQRDSARSAKDIWINSQQQFEESKAQEDEIVPVTLNDVENVKNKEFFTNNVSSFDDNRPTEETSKRRSLLISQSSVDVPVQVHMAQVLAPAVSDYRRKKIQADEKNGKESIIVNTSTVDRSPYQTSSPDVVLGAGRLKDLRNSYESSFVKSDENKAHNSGNDRFQVTKNGQLDHNKSSDTNELTISRGSNNLFLPSPYRRARPVHDMIAAPIADLNKENLGEVTRANSKTLSNGESNWISKKPLTHEEIMNIGKNDKEELVTSFERQDDRRPVSYPSHAHKEATNNRPSSFPAALNTSNFFQQTSVTSPNDSEVKSILTKGRKGSPKKVQFSNFVTFRTTDILKPPVNNPVYTSEEEDEGSIMLPTHSANAHTQKEIDDIVNVINSSSPSISSYSYVNSTVPNNYQTTDSSIESSDYVISGDIYRASPRHLTDSLNESGKGKKSTSKGFLQKAKNKLASKSTKKQSVDQPLSDDTIGFTKTVTQPPLSFNFIGQRSAMLNKQVDLLSAERSPRGNDDNVRDNRIRKRQAGNIADVDILVS
ncbi:uncharacterized protein LOC130662610 isoform X2 [Hydractinia symbiolongicarpus]|uniref:uncharacterized protein LOC130662610 isoform X2 n=1 Tax=Hydractinia symbiolongicarpus TaxID=13093 RepID=UPI0025519326|nr:uncharacterized protein LOC130662610 isoform X2 [Hydractinia symbiolongicarpus]